MAVALFFFTIAGILGAWAAVHERDLPFGLAITGMITVGILVIWLLVAVPFSNYARNNCEALADGYGLDYDWSIRRSCRVYLPSGQLVPEDRIRITSDGQITVVDD